MEDYNPYTSAPRVTQGNSQTQGNPQAQGQAIPSNNQPNSANRNITDNNSNQSPILIQSNSLRTSPPSLAVTNPERIDRLMAFGLLAAALVITIFFYIITDSTTESDCDSLYFASEVNEYLWYYSAILQGIFLLLSYGAHKWSCINFLQDLPKIYRAINFGLLICILTSAIWLQVSLNDSDKCGTLQNLAKNYLILTYILIAITFSYLIYNLQKQTTPSYLADNNQQRTQSTNQQRNSLQVNSARQQNYNTFDN